VVQRDLEESFHYFEGLIIEKGEDDAEEIAAGIEKVT